VLGPEVELRTGKRHRVRKHFRRQVEECFADILRVGHSDAGKVGAAGQEIEDELMTSFGDAGEILGELRRIGGC